MYYAYVLKLSNNNLYTGFSANLKKRLKDHINGEITSTKHMRPLKLVFYAGFISKKKATDFEKYLKTMSGFAFRNKRLI